MSYNRDTANDLVWDEGSQSYIPASDPPTPTPTEYTCNRDTTIDIYEENLDPNTVYNVTDQQDNFINIIRDTIWPVGSIYFGMMETCPLAALFGTWVKISAGRVIQGADENNPAGTIKEAGLPNITGKLALGWDNSSDFGSEGSFYKTNNSSQNVMPNGAGTQNYRQTFDASRSSSIYGNSDTVQPGYKKMYAWNNGDWYTESATPSVGDSVYIYKPLSDEYTVNGTVTAVSTNTIDIQSFT